MKHDDEQTKRDAEKLELWLKRVWVVFGLCGEMATAVMLCAIVFRLVEPKPPVFAAALLFLLGREPFKQWEVRLKKK